MSIALVGIIIRSRSKPVRKSGVMVGRRTSKRRRSSLAGPLTKGAGTVLQGVFAGLRPPARPYGGSVAGPIEGLAGGTLAPWVASGVSGAARVVYTPRRNSSGAKLPPGVDMDIGRGHCRGTPRAGSDLHPTSRRPQEGPAGALLQGSRSWVRTPSHSLLDRSP